jgi:sterol 24-C-methyltransferase
MSPIALEQEDHTRDAEFNKAMHGKSAKARGGMTAMLQKDKAAQQAAVDEYFKHWDNKGAADETEDTRKVRMEGLEVCVRLLTVCVGTTRRIRYPHKALL